MGRKEFMKPEVLLYCKNLIWTFILAMLLVSASIVTIGSKRKTSKSCTREGRNDQVKNVKKATFVLLFAFAVLALASAVNTEPGLEWGPDIPLTTHTATDWYPSGRGIMQDTTETIWFVWTSKRMGNYDIWYKNSSDGGATWSADTQLTTDTAIDDSPSIAQTSDGRIWVVFYSWRSQVGNETNPDLYYMTSSDGGATWSSATQLTTDPDFDLNPSIVQLSDGTIFVAWQSDRIWVQGKPQDDIYYKTSSDSGATWSGDTRLTTDLGDDFDPSVTQTADGKIWIAFVSGRLDPFHIYYTTSSDGGANWSTETQLTTYAGDNWAPSITQTSDGKIWIMFHSPRAGNWDIYYETTSDGGAHWTPDTRLTDHPNYDVVPSITQTADGTIWVAFASYRMGNYDIWYKMYSRHDGAITSVTASPTTVYQGETVTILVGAANEGLCSETFTVTVYANVTVVNSTSVTLASGGTTTLTFSWNTTGAASLSNYTIWAEASVVPGETDTADNVYVDGAVKVKLLGDDLNRDGVVDIIDATILRSQAGETL